MRRCVMKRARLAFLSGVLLAGGGGLWSCRGCGGVADTITVDKSSNPFPPKLDNGSNPNPNTSARPANDPNCIPMGEKNTPFPVDPKTDPNVKDTTGVKLDPNGDLILDSSNIEFNFLWISNTYDFAGKGTCDVKPPKNPALCRGSISKIDAVKLKEVAR
jgi:hypothetical protein